MTDNGHTNGYLTRDDLLLPAERRYIDVALGGSRKVRLQSLTEPELSAYEASILTSKGEFSPSKMMRARRKLICLTVVDGEGNRVLGDEDAINLQNMDGAFANEIYNAAMAHCGIRETDIEDLAKNSERVGAESSP